MTTPKQIIEETARAAERLSAERLSREASELRAANKQLVEHIHALEDRLEAFTQARAFSKPLPPIPTARKGRVLSGDKREGVAFAAASDWHVGERVDPAKVMGLNTYTPDVARVRARRFFEGLAWLIREQKQTFDIHTLCLWLGGDFLAGYIHAELVESNFMSPLEESAYARSLLVDGYRFLRTELPDLRIISPCSFGNHDRTTDRTRIATAGANSYTKAMYLDLALLLQSDEGIQFQVADGHHLLVSLFDYKLHLHHGDSVRPNGGIGGIDVPLNRAAIQWRDKYGAHGSAVGHFHTYQGGSHVIRNGSLIGYGAYSDWLPNAKPEPAQQAFAVVDRKRGLCKQTPIWVQE
jgi:hypothetical protein